MPNEGYIYTHINLTVKTKAIGLKNSVEYVISANASGMFTEAHEESYNCVEWAKQLKEACSQASKREAMLELIKEEQKQKQVADF